MSELQAVAVVVELTLYAFGVMIGFKIAMRRIDRKMVEKWAEWDAKKKAGKNEA